MSRFDGQSAGPELIDESSFEAIREIDPENGDNILSRILALYVSSTPSQVARMLHGFVDHNHDQVRLSAHELRSSSLTVGARTLAARCEELERQANVEFGDAHGELVKEIADTHRRVVAVLQRYCGQVNVDA